MAAISLCIPILLTLVVSADDPVAPPPAPIASTPVKARDLAPAEEFVQVGTIETHVVRRGERGRAIVLIHGFGSSTYTWRRNIDALARDFRVFAIDLKGFGLTAKPRDGEYHLAAYVDHLDATLRTLGIERPILVGNSMGGAVAARFALLHPDRVAGLILVDAAPPDWSPSSGGRSLIGPLPGEPRDPDSKKTTTTRPPSKDDAAAANPLPNLGDRLRIALARTLVTRKMVAAGLASAYHDPKIVTPEMVEVYYRPFLIDGAVEALLAMSRGPLRAGTRTPPLSTLVPPAMIIWGRHDRIIPVAAAERFAQQLPRARKVIFEASGHLPHEEEPDRFNALAAEFAANPRWVEPTKDDRNP